MTVCIAIAEKGRVYMGADSLVAGGYVTFRRALPKIFQNHDYMIGVAGTARIAEIMRYSELPIPSGNIDSFMNTVFPEAVRAIMGALGRLDREDGVETIDSKMLVGVRGTIWTSDGHFSFSRPEPAEYSIGTGDEIAMGSLFSTRGQKPIKRISTALRAAAFYGQNIGPPYVLRTLRK